MKPKYYPHITLTAAVAMLLLPASMLLLISSPDAQSVGELIAAANADRDATTAISTDQRELANQAQSKQRPATRVAMLSATAGDQQIALDARHSDHDEIQMRTTQRPSVAQPSVAQPSVDRTAATTAVIATTEPSEDSSMAYAQPTPEIFETADVDVSGDQNTAMASSEEDDVLNGELEAALAAGSATDDSHFESTGHLAMSGRIGRSNASRSGAMRSKKTKPSQLDSPSDSDGGMPVLLDEDPFASEPKNPIVDMILQQPSERRPVSKVENLVATTQQPGWPIVLVRSDIPDDVWWVQQMVGIRHRSFVSRVNFGNDNSLPGSVYHLVIVFLDSADEARRFRIAKQFKDLPEGLRRSREYTFVRK